MPKERLDVLLVANGLFPTRAQAQRAVMAGEVYVAGVKETKPGTQLAAGTPLEVRGNAQPYVSRGGLKLAKALQTFAVSVAGRTAMDVGASTGGFTDCLLQNGAIHVYAVDVGYGQLDWRLRQDSRVSVLERTNIRYLSTDMVPVVGIITIDVSFISLGKVLPAVKPFLAAEKDLIALVKPQFEAEHSAVGKRGVVRDATVHAQVLQNLLALAAELGFVPQGLTYSPIKGPEGNVEFLLHLKNGGAADTAQWAQVAEDVVAAAHKELS